MTRELVKPERIQNMHHRETKLGDRYKPAMELKSPKKETRKKARR